MASIAKAMAVATGAGVAGGALQAVSQTKGWRPEYLLAYDLALAPLSAAGAATGHLDGDVALAGAIAGIYRSTSRLGRKVSGLPAL